MKNILLLFTASIFCFQNSIAQNIGIGLTNPTRAKLELNGMVGNTTAIFGGDGAGISLQRNNPAIGFNHYYNAGDKYIGTGYAAAQWVSPATGIMYFDFWNSGIANQNATGLTRSMVIKPGGLVGIGNVDPHGELQFVNSLANRKIVLWESANNNHMYYGFGIESGTLRYAVDAPGAAHRFYAANNSTSSSLLMTVGGNKKVVIGTQAGGSRVGVNSGDPQYTFEIVQTANTGLVLIEPLANYNNWELKCWNEPLAANPVALAFFYNGVRKSYIYYGDGNYVQSSDERLKKNVLPLSPLLNKIMQLKAVDYEMKEHNPEHRKSIGFIAQDVKPLFPELVYIAKGTTIGKNIEDMHMMNYSGFGVLAIKAIQEQQLIIQDQQKQIDELKKQMQTLINKQ